MFFFVMLSRLFFFFNDTATTEIYTLSLHDALPIYAIRPCSSASSRGARPAAPAGWHKSEEHTSELQSRFELVCRLLLEKNKNQLRDVFGENDNAQSNSALHSEPNR